MLLVLCVYTRLCVHTQLCLCADVTAKLHLIHLLLLLLVEAAAGSSHSSLYCGSYFLSVLLFLLVLNLCPLPNLSPPPPPPQTPPSDIHGWKATDLLYEMVKTKKYFFILLSVRFSGTLPNRLST